MDNFFHQVVNIQMMHISGHKPPKHAFMVYIKLSSEEIADEIKLVDELEAQVRH